MTRRKQCELCPWKVGTNPHDIPDGYCEQRHRALKNTIAKPGELRVSGALHVMACHESPVGHEQICVGWLDNQLGPGNNILLRLCARRGLFSTDYELDGEQHATLADTLPKSASKKP